MFKTVTLAIAALATTATLASAENSISNLTMEQDSDTQIMLGTVNADAQGVIEVYGYHLGQVGALIGSEMVHAGANLDVDVDVRPVGTDAIAFLKVNGMIVDMQEIDFAD